MGYVCLSHYLSNIQSCAYIIYSSLGNIQVEVEALVIQGPRLATVMSQVKKLEVSVLVLGQKKASPLISW